MVMYRKKRKSLETVSRTTRALCGCTPDIAGQVNAKTDDLTAINMATDVIIVLIPLPIVLKLCISTKQKMILSSIFILGGL